MTKKRVWDLPLRLFHWTLVVLVVVALVSQEVGGNAIEWHFRAGYAIGALLLFRLLWGVVGGRYARFAQFVRGPAAILAALRGAPPAQAGHNPLGALSVLAILAVLLLQVASGLFSNDDIASEGPLAVLVSKAWSDRITWFHKDVSGTLIYVVIGLHLAAIAWYFFWKKQNLVRPMLTGDKDVGADVPAAADNWRTRLLALAILALCAGVMYRVVNLAG